MKELDPIEKVLEKEPEKEKPTAEIAKEESSFKVYGYDFSIKDEEVKQYYRNIFKVMTYDHLLVGKIDDNGNYIISKDIKRDLVVMDKEIEEQGENFYKATNFYMKKNFYFHIKLSVTKEGKAKASLYLSEFVGDYLEDEYIVSHIADYVSDYDQDFRIKVRQAFNLVDVDIPNNDLLTPNIAILMQQLLDHQLFAGSMYDIACQIYVMRMLKALEESGEQGRKIIARYKKLLAELDDEEKGKRPNIKQKALLDRAIDEEGGVEKLPIDPNVKKAIVGDFNKSIKEIEKSSSAVEIEDNPLKEDKKAPAAGGSSKGGGGKSGGGGAKKAGGGGNSGGGGAKKKPAGGSSSGKKEEKKKSVARSPFLFGGGGGYSGGNSGGGSNSDSSKAKKENEKKDKDEAAELLAKRLAEEEARRKAEEVKKEADQNENNNEGENGNEDFMDSVFGLLEQNDGADEENADEEEASENDLETFPNADENADNLNNSNSPYSADEEFGKGGDGEGIYEEENNLG
ncbi:MAG: hypothetical protein J6K97_03550 [Clostridia bacterium]|nr:hypothetical protein [Clostridia bacterium]